MGSSTPPAELELPLNRHGFVTKWGLGMFVVSFNLSKSKRRYAMKKLRLNFHLLLPYVVFLQEVYANTISEKAKETCCLFVAHFN